MSKSTHEMLESPEFRAMVRKRWTISIVLTLLLFVVYYGFILLIAYDKSLMATKVGTSTTVGILAGVGVILAAWVLTGIYVSWANRSHDPEVARLKDQVRR